MKLAFFDTKPYDKPGFDEHIAGTDIEIKYFETRLGEDTVQLAKGFDGVCVFVNDTVNAKVVNELYDLGVRVVALRCAGFNNVDTKACFGKLHVFRVPAYSPYAVAEHAMALLLTVNRAAHPVRCHVELTCPGAGLCEETRLAFVRSEYDCAADCTDDTHIAIRDGVGAFDLPPHAAKIYRLENRHGTETGS